MLLSQLVKLILCCLENKEDTTFVELTRLLLQQYVLFV